MIEIHPDDSVGVFRCRRSAIDTFPFFDYVSPSLDPRDALVGRVVEREDFLVPSNASKGLTVSVEDLVQIFLSWKKDRSAVSIVEMERHASAIVRLFEDGNETLWESLRQGEEEKHLSLYRVVSLTISPEERSGSVEMVSQEEWVDLILLRGEPKYLVAVARKVASSYANSFLHQKRLRKLRELTRPQRRRRKQREARERRLLQRATMHWNDRLLHLVLLGFAPGIAQALGNGEEDIDAYVEAVPPICPLCLEQARASQNGPPEKRLRYLLVDPRGALLLPCAVAKINYLGEPSILEAPPTSMDPYWTLFHNGFRFRGRSPRDAEEEIRRARLVPASVMDGLFAMIHYPDMVTDLETSDGHAIDLVGSISHASDRVGSSISKWGSDVRIEPRSEFLANPKYGMAYIKPCRHRDG